MQAYAGHRSHYQPIHSVISPHVDAVQLVEDLLHYFPFQKLYMADLDAITSGWKDRAFYQRLAAQFPQLEIWLDCGIRTQEDWRALAILPNIHCVLATETMQSWSWLSHVEDKSRILLSLDYQQGQLLGHERVWSMQSHWPSRIIVMNLDRVGVSQGPDYSLISHIQGLGNYAVIAAGGVRDGQDLQKLAESGVKQVLVATAIHQGHITPEMIQYYLDLDMNKP